jgi:DNA-binding response OmpR family regulator
VEALLRRPRDASRAGAPRVFADMSIDAESRVVTIAGKVVELTRIEFDLLDAMSSAPKIVFSRLQLLERVWGPGWVGDDHVIDVHIANLRKKIDAPGARSRVRTVRGIGYSMGG